MEAFTDAQRALFESTAEVLHLRRGEYLLRRGEAGGDLFLLREGQLEAVDHRVTPEVILAVMTPGAVVGEMSFLDGSPRSVDVRVGLDAVVLRWAQRDLRSLLRREPTLAAAFYESVAQLASVRMRRLTDNAMTGGLIGSGGEAGDGVERARLEAERLADTVKASLLQCETLLRESPDDVAAEGALREALYNLQAELGALLQSWPDPLAREALAEELQRELHPYLVRSTLADRCIRRPQGITATPEILAQVLVARPSGEGKLGEQLDRWLLDRPTFSAMRDHQRTLPPIVGQLLPRHRNRRVLVLGAGTGSLVARLGARFERAPTHLTVVDPSREALSLLDTEDVPLPPGVTISAVQHNLAELAVGRLRHRFQPVDVIVLHHLVEYLPDRLAVSLLRVCGGLLNPEGHVVTASFAESADQDLLDRLLRWPTLRRGAQALMRLHHAADLRDVQLAPTPAPGLVVTAGTSFASEGANR